MMRCTISSLLLSTQVIATAAVSDAEGYFGGAGHLPYLEWINETESGIDYHHSTYMSSFDPGNGAAIHWSIDGEYLNLAVAARATGWVGFGISEAGGMKGSDVVLFKATTKNLVDAHILDEPSPIEDVHQDWELLHHQVSGDFLIFEGRRLLDTGDAQDRPIIYDADPDSISTRVIAAWGDTEDVSYHGFNRARSSIFFHANAARANENDIFEATMIKEAESSFVIAADNHLIPAMETEYVDFCFPREHMLDQGVPMDDDLFAVGFEPLIDLSSAQHVHHIIVYGSFLPNSHIDETTCDEAEFEELVFVWAPGEGPFALPLNVGTLLGGSRGLQSFSMEVHYNNPILSEGIYDNSGFKFYYTTQQREHALGVLELGDRSVDLYGNLVGEGLSEHTFDCPSTCSQEVVKEPVTVLREYLHMHSTGASINNEQVRNGQVVRTGAVDFWDFAQNGNSAVRQLPFQVFPGDSFRTHCFFNGKNDTIFGLSSREEMCIAFLFYYPRQEMNGRHWGCYYNLGMASCNATYATDAVDDISHLGRTFGVLDSTEDFNTYSAGLGLQVRPALALCAAIVFLVGAL